MPVITCKSNATAHPGQIITESQQIKCTKQQIQVDHAKAKQVVITKQESAAANHCAVIKSIRGLQGAEYLGEMDGCLHAHQLNLHGHTVTPPNPQLSDEEPEEPESENDSTSDLDTTLDHTSDD